MNEMIYGNTGRRDEGINIDMEQALYQKLQSRTYVPKLKSMLNDRLQEGDKNFVFIGEVSDKSGNFSVYGYNAKLESDSRGGDYGHYIAVPVNDKAVSVDINNIEFLTEEGFVEYVNLKELNNEKRFKISPKSIDIDTNSKKRIINNLMETFMKVRKRKNVTFSFEDCAADEFTEKSLFVLIDLMKYLPYRMRKNVSFMSHVASNQKLPDMINLAVYPASSEFKPHDCIALGGGASFGNDGVFAGYVEKVFSMNDAEREAYFEKIYEDIEKPALEKGVEVKADLYLLDISTKELWSNGDVEEAIVNIFNSASDVLAVYPFYAELARKRLTDNERNVVEYIKNRVDETNSPEELKVVYSNLMNVYTTTKFDMNTNVAVFFTNRANVFIENANGDEDIIKVVGGIVSINAQILDQEYARNKFRSNMSRKADTNEIYSFYLKLKEKKFIDAHELNICLNEGVEELILKETEGYSEQKEKLEVLEKMYEEFKAACTARDYPHVKEVYDVYKDKFSAGANAAAKSKGNDIIYGIDKEIKGYCTFLDIKDCIIRLSEVEVKVDAGLKQKASDIYRRISMKMFEEMEDDRLTYEDFKKLIQEIGPAVEKLNENEVYDEQLRSGWGSEKFVPNGMYRLVTIFEAMIDATAPTNSLVQVLLGVQKAKELVKDESNLKKIFEKFAPSAILGWMDKNKKTATLSALKKAKKELKKKHDKRLSQTVEEIFAECLEKKNKGKKGRKPSIAKLIIIVVVAVAIIGGLVYCGMLIFGNKESEVMTVESKHIYTDEKAMVEQYLEGYNGDNLDLAQVVLAKISEVKNEEVTEVKKYKVTVTDAFAQAFEGEFEAVYGAVDANTKKLVALEGINADTIYAVVLQKDKNGEVTYIRDVFALPNDLKNYDFRTEYVDEKIKADTEEQKFYSNMLRYIGYKSGVLTEAERPKESEEVKPDEQKETENVEKETQTEIVPETTATPNPSKNADSTN